MRANVSNHAAVCNPADAVCFFDKIAMRMNKKISQKDLNFMQRHSRSIDQRIGHHIRGSNHDWLLTLVAPDEDALKLLADKVGLFVNYCEVALDILTHNRDDAERLSDVFDAHFVQPRHGKDETYAEEFGTYTKRNRPGQRFVWYWDRPSKKLGAPCLHVEARAHGVVAVRRLGINEPGDLLTFDHDGFWRQHLTLYSVDLERLGRAHENKRTSERRQKPAVSWHGTLAYNADRRRGATLFRLFGETDAFTAYCRTAIRTEPEFDEVPDQRFVERSTQRFVDTYGRGSFMRRIDMLLFVI